jgi:hypothetical protein
VTLPSVTPSPSVTENPNEISAVTDVTAVAVSEGGSLFKQHAYGYARPARLKERVMGNGPNSVTGGCHCGAVRYEAQGTPVYVPYCHCITCRKTTGAPVVAFVRFEAAQVRFTKGERKIYASSPEVGRGFCPDCGTPLTYEADWGGKTVVEVHISTLDDPERFTPDRHAFFGERISWFDVVDKLPRYDTSSVEADPIGFGPSS